MKPIKVKAPERKFVRCKQCKGTGDCAACGSKGVTWNDGVLVTVCPGGKMTPEWRARLETLFGPDVDVDTLPCGRSANVCPGCGRSYKEIGLSDDDKTRTRAG